MALPVTILTSQKLANLLTNNDALQAQIAAIAELAGASVPPITTAQVVLSSAGSDMCDKNIQLTYPRVCLYSNGVKNTHIEKFKSLSGTVSVITEIWASGNFVSDTDQWIHFYVEAVTEIYRQNIGNLNDGIYFSGAYDVQFQPPKSGGFGFSQSAKVTCILNVGQN
ncbi:MAG TPA: hypothetical protein VFA65_16105 [Bryobacteraceae bacterium]|nr:hypothetical protein [Bryobacteraceae bacterium]